MKNIKIVIKSFLFCLVLVVISAKAQDTTKTEQSEQNQIKEQNQQQIQHGQNFVDEDGDGYNDNAPDHDGDGIPNGLDPDYQGRGKKFVDLDGDGINDNIYGKNQQKRKRGVGPKDQKQVQSPGQQSGDQKGQKRKGRK